MKILGLTGSIAMGKTTVAKMFAQKGIPVHNADEAVHRGFKDRKVINDLQLYFPSAINNKTVDRKKLSNLVFGNKELLKKLEEICHEYVDKDRKIFLSLNHRLRKPFVMLDVPLLFETNLDKLCNMVFVVTAPKFLQYQRAMKRENMTDEKFYAILNRQMNDYEKQLRADAVIQTGGGKHTTYKQVVKIFNRLP